MNEGVDFTVFTALHRFLTRDVVSMSLLVMWAASQRYLNSFVTLEFVSTVRVTENTDYDYPVLGIGYGAISHNVPMGHVMTTAPIFLLLETVEFHDGEWRNFVEILG